MDQWEPKGIINIPNYKGSDEELLVLWRKSYALRNDARPSC